MSSLPLDTSLTLPDRFSSQVAEPPVTGSVSPVSSSFDATKDARKIVRLLQCSRCSHPLTDPVTLPCGNSVCKACIPESHPRANISYPATANRLHGFICPFDTCRKEHAVEDCGSDVSLKKIMTVVKQEVDAYRETAEASQSMLQVEVRDRWAIAGLPSLRDESPKVRTFPGGLLVATYSMAEEGSLAYDSEISHTTLSSNTDSLEAVDTAVLAHLKEATRAEFDCHLCYALYLDPLTSTCGHTFCRKCLHRVLDYSNLCPLCRQSMSIAPGVSARQAPSNSLLTKLIAGLVPDGLEARVEMANREAQEFSGDSDTPLFVCTLSFPHMPTFLHIFEPRYRLMIRRAIENGDRKFGMLLPNMDREPQGSLGTPHFLQYGTLLHIENMHLMPDGRSLIETVGVSRFRVLGHRTLDGYTVGKIERVNDISIGEEEALEASETSSSSISRHFSAQEHFGAPPHHVSRPSPTTSGTSRPASPVDLNTMSTQDLMQIGTAFVKKMREQSAPWLHRKVLLAYGEPPEDPAVFPWWFASVLPTAEEEKYKLLATSSVRERLKLCASWIAQLETQRWSQASSCTVV